MWPRHLISSHVAPTQKKLHSRDLFTTSTTAPSPTTKPFDNLAVHDLLAAAQTHRRPEPPTHSDHNLTLPLLRRDSIFGPRHPTHLHRVTSILSRDSLRFSSLSASLSGAGAIQPAGFGSDVISGLDEGSGEYFVRVGVGSPPRDQLVVIDSGSDVVWVQCRPCTQCYRQSDPLFDPADSASFTAVSCRSPLCRLLAGSAGCGSGRCRYEVSYGDGSYTEGTLALETLAFGQTTIRNVAMGCGHRNRGLFVGAAGLLGLGWGPMSFVGQLGGQVGGAFSYCLASRGSPDSGSLVFGRSQAIPAGAVWVPLLRSPRAPSFYFLGLVGLGVGGAQLPVSENTFQLSSEGDGGAVLDTGTAVTRLPDAAYEILRDAFVAGTAGLPRAPGVAIFDTCYDLYGYGSVRVPTVSLYFEGGAILTLPAKNFLIPVDDGGTFCFAFAPSGSGLSILGNIQQEGIQITVDSANGFVGFGPQTC